MCKKYAVRSWDLRKFVPLESSMTITCKKSRNFCSKIVLLAFDSWATLLVSFKDKCNAFWLRFGARTEHKKEITSYLRYFSLTRSEVTATNMVAMVD